MKLGRRACFLTAVLVMAIVHILIGSIVANAAAPNLIGVWAGTVRGYNYDNVLDPANSPQLMVVTANFFRVTAQRGYSFAGFSYENGVKSGKMTGVMLSDNTVTINIVDNNSRTSMRGKVSVVDNVLTMRGTVTSDEDLTRAEEPGTFTGSFDIRKQ